MQEIYQQWFEEGLVTQLLHGNPGIDAIREMLEPLAQEGSLLVLDDGLSQMCSNMDQLFYQISHHTKADVIFIGQNLFCNFFAVNYLYTIYLFIFFFLVNHKSFRTLSLNLHYLFLLKNPRYSMKIFIK